MCLPVYHFANTCRNIPAAHSAFKATSPESFCICTSITTDANSGDVSLMALYDSNWFLGTFANVVEIAIKVQTNNEAITPARRPDHADLMIWYTHRSFFTKAPVLNHFSNLYIPDLNSLIGACCDKLLRISRPGNAENAAFMLTISDLVFWLPCFAIIQPN